MAGPYVSSDALNYVGIGKQTTKGTAVTPTVFAIYQDKVDLDHGMDGDDIFEGGVGPYVARTMKTKHDPTGGFSQAWRPKTCAQLAAWFLGADSSTASGTQFLHTSTYSQTLTYFTVEHNLSDEFVDRFTDCFLNSFKISGEGGGDLMLENTWFGFTPGWQTTTVTETYESGVSGTSAGGPYRLNEAVYVIDGSTATNVQGWSIELALKYDEDIRLSAITRSYTVKLELSGKVKMKELPLDTVNYRSVNYGSSSGTAANKNFFSGSFKAVFDNALATTSQRTVTINAPQVDWRSAPKPVLNAKGETAYLEREGTLKKISGSDFIAISSLTADTSAYI